MPGKNTLFVKEEMEMMTMTLVVALAIQLECLFSVSKFCQDE
jgi:hypothetical protein